MSVSIGPTSTDADLVAETRNGSHQAFRELVMRYEGTVAATVIGMLGPGSEAEDAGQDVMIRFYQSLDRFEGKSSLKTYITRIAVNQSIDVIRRRK
ncbi:MAG: sigma-70 family RNA polymerase sigma factor, partial [Sphingomonadales bacterium]|nr:sigma-70 family RNA polymerase sigma factor [Sphingomonadales bacterium]